MKPITAIAVVWAWLLNNFLSIARRTEPATTEASPRKKIGIGYGELGILANLKGLRPKMSLSQFLSNPKPQASKAIRIPTTTSMIALLLVGIHQVTGCD
jgi:hypothetical protein